MAYFGAANLDNFLIIASKTFLDYQLQSRDTAAEGGPGKGAGAGERIAAQ